MRWAKVKLGPTTASSESKTELTSAQHCICHPPSLTKLLWTIATTAKQNSKHGVIDYSNLNSARTFKQDESRPRTHANLANLDVLELVCCSPSRQYAYRCFLHDSCLLLLYTTIRLNPNATGTATTAKQVDSKIGSGVASQFEGERKRGREEAESGSTHSTQLDSPIHSRLSRALVAPLAGADRVWAGLQELESGLIVRSQAKACFPTPFADRNPSITTTTAQSNRDLASCLSFTLKLASSLHSDSYFSFHLSNTNTNTSTNFHIDFNLNSATEISKFDFYLNSNSRSRSRFLPRFLSLRP